MWCTWYTSVKIFRLCYLCYMLNRKLNMNRTWSVICLINVLSIIILLVYFAAGKNFDQRTRFKSSSCTNNAVEVVTFHECKVRVSRTASWVSLDFTFKKSVLKPLYIQANVSYKYGQIYRNVFSLQKIEICYLVKNQNKIQYAHPLIVVAADIFGKSLQPLSSGCPYLGRQNVSVNLDDTQLPSLFPTGMYKLEVHFKIQNGGSVVLTAQIECVSSLKTSF